MAAIDPDVDISTKIALEGGYDPCGTLSGKMKGIKQSQKVTTFKHFIKKG